MDKTLGQIAYEAVVGQVSWAAFPWARMNNDQRQGWEAIAAAVAAAVKEEDARICEGERVEEIGEGDEAYNWATKHCAAAIRASIKP